MDDTDPAPIIVTALFAPDDQARFDRLRRAHFPPERNLLDAHLTLFHHLPPSIERELVHRLATETRGTPPPPARVIDVMSLGRGVALRIASPGLDAIRAGLAEAFAGLLTPQDRAGWRAHVTIQNKVAPTTAQALRAALLDRFVPYPVTFAGLAAWRYRGGPWELVTRQRFG